MLGQKDVGTDLPSPQAQCVTKDVIERFDDWFESKTVLDMTCSCELETSACYYKPLVKKQEELCKKEGTQENLSLFEAIGIAMSSECNQAELKETAVCNEYTGTWWIDLDIEKSNCSPACVVDVATKQAEINWRCTGALP